MSRTPYPISGEIKDPDQSTLSENTIVTFYNETKGEETTQTATTNESGEYTLDLANATTEYENGDIIVIKATKGEKLKRFRFTLDTSTGYYEKNLTLSYIDIIGLFKDIITDGWQKGNTDLKTPKIVKILDYKRPEISTLDNETWILIYELTTLPQKNSIGTLTRRLKHIVTLDIRSIISHSHALSVRNEVDRVLGTKLINPVEGYDILNLDINAWKDLSDKNRKSYRFLMDVEIEKLNMTRSNEYLS